MSYGYAIKDKNRYKIKRDKNVQLLSLDQYLKDAQKAIRQHCSPSLRWTMLRSEDAISFVGESLMYADWDYDESKGLSREKFRRIRARNAITDYIKACKTRKNSSIRLEKNTDIEVLKKLYEDKRVQRADYENNSDNCDRVNYLMTSSDLTQIQKNTITDHYLLGMRLSDIARERGVSRQMVLQSIQSGLRKMKLVGGISQ